jgi:hypothetical protein
MCSLPHITQISAKYHRACIESRGTDKEDAHEPTQEILDEIPEEQAMVAAGLSPLQLWSKQKHTPAFRHISSAGERDGLGKLGTGHYFERGNASVNYFREHQYTP